MHGVSDGPVSAVGVDLYPRLTNIAVQSEPHPFLTPHFHHQPPVTEVAVEVDAVEAVIGSSAG